MVGSAVRSISTEGTDPQAVFEGEIDGSPMQPDDLAFGPDGSMYISDTTGLGGTSGEVGRVIRVTPDGDASVFAENLPAPNGISFDENLAGLWVAQYNANRIDYLSLDADGELAEAHGAIHIDAGRARVDSTAVDADGNIYQMFHNRTAVEVFDHDGAHLETIEVPNDHELGSATNIAIEPGTTNGVITVSGDDGGHLYTFDAPAEGTRQSNGGWGATATSQDREPRNPGTSRLFGMRYSVCSTYLVAFVRLALASTHESPGQAQSLRRGAIPPRGVQGNLDSGLSSGRQEHLRRCEG